MTNYENSERATQTGAALTSLAAEYHEFASWISESKDYPESYKPRHEALLVKFYELIVDLKQGYLSWVEEEGGTEDE